MRHCPWKHRFWVILAAAEGTGQEDRHEQISGWCKLCLSRGNVGQCSSQWQKLFTFIQMMCLMALCKSHFYFEKGTGLPFKLKMELDFSGSSSRFLLSTGESPCIHRVFKWGFTVSSLGCGVRRVWRKSDCHPSALLNMWMFHLALDARNRKRDLSWGHAMLRHLASYLEKRLPILSYGLDIAKYNARGLFKCSCYPWKHCSPSP